MPKNPIQAIVQAYRIMDLCTSRRKEIERRRDSLKRKSRSINVAKWIARSNEIDRLSKLVSDLEDRKRKVWGAVTNFQGKYIQWKTVHVIDGKTYSGLISLIDAAQHIYYKVENGELKVA